MLIAAGKGPHHDGLMWKRIWVRSHKVYQNLHSKMRKLKILNQVADVHGIHNANIPVEC
jgi:hypothetical protein